MLKNGSKVLLITYTVNSCTITVFTWLNAVAFIALVPKINAATIQVSSALIAHKQCSRPCSYNQLWAYSRKATIQGVVFHQVNTVLVTTHVPLLCITMQYCILGE